MIAIAAVTVGLMSVGQTEPLPHLGSLTEQLRAPARIAIAPDDSVLVTDPLSRHVVRFNASGDFVETVPVPEGPIGVAVHPDDGRVFVSLRDEPKVAVYDSAFSFIEYYLGENEPLVSFVRPTDIDIAADTGRVYVVDAEGDKIYGFEGDGSLLILGSRGSWPGEFVYPSAITIDEPRNRIIVADHDKYRLQIFTTAGVFLQQFGDRLKSTGGELEGWMPRPQGLAVDAAGRIYLSDALMGTVRVFDPTGVELGKVVEYGYEPGELRTPCDLALSNDGSRLYVASVNSSRVEVYDTTIKRQTVETSKSQDFDVSTFRRFDVSLEVQSPPDGDPQQLREITLDGPHLVEERSDICKICHRIEGQPGGDGGTIEGQPALCMSCHNAGGRSLRVAIYERDVADPFGTNPTAADGRGRSHAWGVPAVNSLAGSDGPLAGGVMSQHVCCEEGEVCRVDGCEGGIMKCSTCHEQHNTLYGTFYLRVSNDGDAMCKECHAPHDRGVGEGGSHPVGIAYPEGEDEYPEVGELDPLFIKEGMVECMTCHAPHGADSGGANDGDGDGMLLRQANDERLCQSCHTQHPIHEVAGDWQPTCRECHDIHDAAEDNENVGLIARVIDETPVSYVEPEIACSGNKDFIHGVCDPPSYDGVCEVCHTDTKYHRNSPELTHTHGTDTPCTDCHPHSIGFLTSDTSCTVCHGEPPDGTASPNRAGAHAVHVTGVNGPYIPDCDTCHALQDSVTHDNGTVSYASGFDANGDGDIDLAETDVCDTCHSEGGPFDGVNDPVIGAKTNWMDGVYEGDVLKPGKEDWCAGCHDSESEGAEVLGIPAPPVARDNVTGHRQFQVVCTDCHDPGLSHTDGVAKTFISERWPLSAGDPLEEREADRETYNNGYRLRRINGERALAVPRDAPDPLDDMPDYTPDDSRLCFCCHDEIKLLGVPANYGSYVSTLENPPPAHLQLPEGVAQTNYRNEYEEGHGWDPFELGEGKPVNVHWDHMGNQIPLWDVDNDDFRFDSCFTCVTCHNPHGVRGENDEPTAAMTRADLAITFGVYDVYNDGTTLLEYGYIGSGAFYEEGGDLNCQTCHWFFGPGEDPPDNEGDHTRFYREWLDLSGTASLECQDEGGRGAKATGAVGNRIRERR